MPRTQEISNDPADDLYQVSSNVSFCQVANSHDTSRLCYVRKQYVMIGKHVVAVDTLDTYSLTVHKL